MIFGILQAVQNLHPLSGMDLTSPLFLDNKI